MLRRGATRLSSSYSMTTTTSTSTSSLLSLYDNFIVDLDGVLWHEDHAVPGAVEAIDMLRRKGKQIAFVTNTSASSRMQRLTGFAKLGFHGVVLDELTTSGWAAARYVIANGWKRVYLVGEDGLQQELEGMGINVLGGSSHAQLRARNAVEFEALHVDPKGVDAVVVGWDRELNYAKICLASLYVERGAKLIATNRDAYDAYPKKGNWPGAGTAVAAVEAACPHAGPITVTGKPSGILIEHILTSRKWDKARTIMVGDRLDTDIVFGKNGGIDTCLVLSGVTPTHALKHELEKFHMTVGGDKTHPVHVRQSLAHVVMGNTDEHKL